MEIQSQNYGIENPQIGLPAGETFTSTSDEVMSGETAMPAVFDWLVWSLFAIALLTLILSLVELKRHKWRRLVWPFALAIGCLIWAVILLLRQPASSMVQVDGSNVEPEAVTMLSLDGDYFDLQYPSSWKLNWHEREPSKEFLERAQLTIAQPHPYRLVASVEKQELPFDEIPSVQARRRDANGDYDERVRNIAGHKAVEFVLTNSAAFERTLFWIQAGRLYVLSLTSPTNADDADQLFDTYVESFAS